MSKRQNHAELDAKAARISNIYNMLPFIYYRLKNSYYEIEHIFLELANTKNGIEQEYYNFYELFEKWIKLIEIITNFIGHRTYHFFKTQDKMKVILDKQFFYLSRSDRLNMLESLINEFKLINSSLVWIVHSYDFDEEYNDILKYYEPEKILLYII